MSFISHSTDKSYHPWEQQEVPGHLTGPKETFDGGLQPWGRQTKVEV